MKILYYFWGELMATTAQKAMSDYGIEYDVISPQRTCYDYDEQFSIAIKDKLYSGQNEPIYNAIFTFNYFPDLSRVALECGVKYISWVYDAPHLTLESVTLSNECNYVFIFDYALYSKYKDKRIDTVFYMPLPARIIYDRGDIIEYEHDITFMGNLYDGEQDQYGQINSLPEYLQGYIDAVISAQQRIYGADIFEELISEEMYLKLSQYIHTELGTDYNSCAKDIFFYMLRRRVTMNERIEVLSRIGNLCQNGTMTDDKTILDLYCSIDHTELPVRYLGFADYHSEMPEIFHSSKINLNITLRSIQTGIPLRIMDIMGAGGFCITNYQPELEEYFENGVDLVWYESIDDLESKCRYYLNHKEEREEIAHNGQEKVKRLFSYDRQLARIIMICER